MEMPECFHGDFFRAGTTSCAQEKKGGAAAGGGGGERLDHFVVEDLLDFFNEDEDDASGEFASSEEAGSDGAAGNSTDSSTVTAVDSCSNSFSGAEAHFPAEAFGRCLADVGLSGDLCEPYDDLAELEWLSNFVDDSSFSSNDLHKLPLISGTHSAAVSVTAASSISSSPTDVAPQPAIFRPEAPVPGKARSKRSRVATGSWSSRLLVLSPSMNPAAQLSESELIAPPPPPPPPQSPVKKAAKVAKKKFDPSAGGGPALAPAADGRKCLHCQTDKTPQWRTGPMGPKTLCNACGVRFKSGRLVPEYRPAASPTFVLSKHSNSHRKVLELRRQKVLLLQQQQPRICAGGGGGFYDGPPTMSVAVDDFLIHHHVGADFRQLI